MTTGLLALGGGAVGLVAAAPVAALTLSVPDRSDRDWYRVWRATAARPSARRIVVSGSVSVLFVAMGAIAGGWSALLPAWLLLAVILAPLAIIDAEHHRLPDRLVLSGYVGGAALLTVAAAIRADWTDLTRSAIAAAGVFAIFTVAAAAGGIGFGDAKLVGLLAGYLGWLGWTEVVGGVFLGFVIGAVEALVLLATRQARLRSAIAFGPALMLGTLLVGAFG